MIIDLSNTRLIQEIQNEFNKTFPYLRISFFSNSHTVFQGNSKKKMLPQHTEIKFLKPKKTSIEIKEDMSVIELEQLFKNELGLNIQVFRKSGKSWLETTVTNNWSLKKQNIEGKELSSLQD